MSLLPPVLPLPSTPALSPSPVPLRGGGVVTCGVACTASGAKVCGCWLVVWLKVPTEGTVLGDAPATGLALPGEGQRRWGGEMLPAER